MRCSICNKRLKTDEISVGQTGKWEPCSECIAVASDLEAIVTPEETSEYLTVLPSSSEDFYDEVQ